ncbi:hypothetical protein ABZ234_10145 [Nocardiopsis sp. NPDC006198]|uniref:hypothetical protein n=1 Tax=Nocardiopsis sp. NPDC006198 TaxID=3154472 RepID=UPI0033A2F7B4
MFAPPAPPLVFTPTAKGGSGVGGRRPDGTRDNGEPVPAPEHPAPAPDKNED